MPKFKNVSSVGDLYFPLIGRVVTAGEVFDVSDEDAEYLTAQPDNFEPITSKGNSK